MIEYFRLAKSQNQRYFITTKDGFLQCTFVDLKNFFYLFLINKKISPLFFFVSIHFKLNQSPLLFH
jgi:hypothetical protein